MKRHLLSRYERDVDGSILIDVTATRTEDLYSDFDRSAPYVRRDLDQDLVDYLVYCAREVAGEPFAIRFILDRPPDDVRVSRIRRSVNGYFLYLEQLERQKIYQMMRRSAILLIIGVAILFISMWVNRSLGPERSVVANVFAEGLTVAAWVSLWEALAIFLLEWFPHRKGILLYRRLANARLVFGAGPAAKGHSGSGPQPGNPADSV